MKGLTALFCISLPISASGTPEIKKALSDLAAQLDKEAEADKKSHDKLGCWCQENVADVTTVVNNAQSKSEDLHHKIEAKQASNSQYSIEIESHEKDVASTQQSIDQANSIRDQERSKFADDEAAHMSSVSSLDNALKALHTGHGHEMDLTLAALRKKLQKSLKANPKANKLMLLVNKQLRGKLNPDVMNGILERMKGTFEDNLEQAQKDDKRSRKQFEDILGAKQEMLDAQASNLANKKRFAAQNAVELAEAKKQQESLDRSLEADTALLMATKELCKVEDDGFAARKMERMAESTAISEAQASLAVASLAKDRDLSQLTTLSSMKRSPLSGDGKERICAVADEIETKWRKQAEDGKETLTARKWQKQAQTACEAAKAGKKTDAAQATNALKKAVEAAQRKAQDNSISCKHSLEDAHSNVNVYASKRERSQHAVESMESEINSVKVQSASNDKLKSDLLAARDAQHEALQQVQFTCYSAAKILQKAAEKAKGIKANAKLNEALKHSDKLASMAKEAEANTDKNIAAVLDAQKGSIKALRKAMIPLKLAKARAEEDAINARQNHESAELVDCDAEELRNKASELSDLSKELGDASEALDFWA